MAAIAALDGNVSPLAKAIRVELQASLARPDDVISQSASDGPIGLRMLAVTAARQLRSSREIGDDAFHLLEEEIDRLELSSV